MANFKFLYFLPMKTRNWIALETYDTHQILFAENIPAFENVANLDQLPATGAHVIALPMVGLC